MMSKRIASVLVFIAIWSVANVASGSPREHGGRYTARRLAHARQNCEQLEWATRIREAAVKAAAPWVAKSDTELWAMVPGQDLPRCIDVTMDRNVKEGPKRLGCLNCGDDINAFGNYPYEPDFRNAPWKLTCPSCKVVFPTNDFGKFYSSAIDEHGLFDPARGDRSLLFNVEHPDPDDPLHKFGVDDGFGYIDENGRAHKFIGYYTWKYWRYLFTGVKLLADAFVYTGDQRYAHKAAVLLDRIADVYPSMEWQPYAERGWFHSDGGTTLGKIEGRIWECNLMTSLLDAYDKILSGTTDAPELYEFLQSQSRRYKLPSAKGSREQFVKNVDDRVVREVVRGIHAGKIIGNEGMHQRTMATCAVVLDQNPETTQWLNWVFAPDGGALPALIVGELDRDGVSPEAGPGYALSWGAGFADIASLLADYGRYAGHDLYERFPQFRATFTAAYRMAALGRATPNIGDSGATGAIGLANVNPEFMIEGFRYTGDPAMAVAAYRANGNSAAGLGRDIFAEDPETLTAEIERLGKQAGPRPVESSLMSGYGLALLESDAGPTGAALTLYYGRSIFHGHLDHLNFDLFAFGNWLAPDHGYPEFATTWPHRTAVTNNSLSHNLVVVDQRPQNAGYGGKTRLFARLPGLSLIEADAAEAYDQARIYSRTMLHVDAPNDNAYIVDIFRVVGGKDHVYSFHGPPGPIAANGLNLIEQKTGTYAGPDVAFKADTGPLGYSYFYNVRRDGSPAETFTLDWHAQAGYRGVADSDDLHLRLHSLSACDDVALADVDPPQNKPGNPRRLGYALLHRADDNELASTFTSVIEPYREKPFIRSVKRLETGSVRAFALRIESAEDVVDHVVVNFNEAPVRLPNGISLNGKAALVRESAGAVVSAALIEGEQLTYGKLQLAGHAAIRGQIRKMSQGLDGGAFIWIDGPVPDAASLAGRHIFIDNDNERDATYLIHSVQPDGDLIKIDCGPISFVRGYAGAKISVRGKPVPRSYDQGFLHDFAEGDSFRIPLHQSWSQ